MITEKQFTMIKQLCERGSMQSLSHITNGFQLSDFQTFSLAASFILEKCVISLDTGLGKTIVAGALINLDLSTKRWLFVSKNNNLIQTARKLGFIINDRYVQYCSGKLESIKNIMLTCQPNSVVVITYDTLNNIDFLKYLFSIRDSFNGIIIDESHNIGNKGSNRSEMLKHMMRNSFRYQYMLTATPLSINPFQIINQINMIDEELVPDPEALAMKHTIYENGKQVGYKNLDELADMLEMRYISFTREELGIKGNYIMKLYLCQMKKKPSSIDELRAAKSDSSNPAMQQLIILVKKLIESGKHGLIYANLSLYKDMIFDELSKFCQCAVLDGRCDARSKSKIQQDYNSGRYDVLISNLEEGADLPSDFILFYELSVKYKQFIGRGERGLSGKDMEISFIILDGYEVEFFYRNIFKRSLLLEALCKKDVSDIKEIENQLSKVLSDDLLYDLNSTSILFEEEEDN